MIGQMDVKSRDISHALATERARIIRLCAYLSGDAESAEDLAQETLIEAWRNAGNLRDINALPAWLSGIARNVCLRSRRRSSREPRRDSRFDNTESAGQLAELADGIEFEVELERNDLAVLLDQALALLPEKTREILISRYVQEESYTEIAEQLGISEGVVATRIHRGKVRLKQLLTTTLYDEAVSLRLLNPLDHRLRETGIWCSLCGNHQLEGYFDPRAGDLVLRCPRCYPVSGVYETNTFAMPELFDGVDHLPAAHDRLVTTAGRYFRGALRDNSTKCLRCGGPADVVANFPPGTRLSTVDWCGIHVRCHSCDNILWGSLSGILLSLPTMQAFRRASGRIRTLPQRQISIDGRPALVVRYESITSSQQRSIVFMRDSYAILHVNDEPVSFSRNLSLPKV